MYKSTGALVGAVFVLSILLLAAIAYPLLRPSSATGPSLLTGVPDVRQSTNYSCGAASLQAVLSYWGVDKREGELMERLHTSEDNGTGPLEIVRVAEELDMNPTWELGLTVEDLASSVRDGIPVIIVAQAWTEDHSPGFSWAEDWEDGHYMVVIGVDASYVYLEDPAILGSRGMIPINEFNARWHDLLGTAPGTIVLEHMGIFIKGSGHAQTPNLVEVQ